MDGMTTTSMLDRVVRWNLDLDGDIYGDERERLRWYEGITTAASMQWIGVPWAAAALVWVLGKPSVLPLAVVLVVLVVPMALCTAYVRRRRVDTVVRSWSRKRVVLSSLGGVPFVVFFVGALFAYDRSSHEWQGAAAGALFGAVLGGVMSAAGKRRRRRQEEAAAAAGDED